MNFTYSIVIPTYNNPNLLLDCITSICRCSNMAQTEVIVVDNGSDKTTEDYCNAFKERLLDSFSYIKLEENTGFCKATNIGLRKATGSYLVWLNDDTIVTPNWLENLRFSIDTPHLYHPKIGLAGPKSNYVRGDQSFVGERVASPDDIPKALTFIEQNKDKWEAQETSGKIYNTENLSVFLSGFCLMLKREVLDTIGYIDESFSPGGFDDNDYSLRAIYAGYGAVISERTFVYHHGSTTLKKLYPEMSGGWRNWATYVKKYQTTKDKKVVMIQLVKIDTDHQLSIFDRCARVNEKYADRVIILSDKSQHPKFTLEYLKSIFGEKLTQFMVNKKDSPMNEIRDRMALMNAATACPEDWMMLMDHDECIEPSYPLERFKALLNPLNPEIQGYNSWFNHYWRSDSMAREDGVWGKAWYARIWKNKLYPVTLRPSYGAEDVGLHCGNRPMSIPKNGFVACDMVINHYGYSSNEDIEKKRNWYQATDKSLPAIKKIYAGSEDYSHITDETCIQVAVPKPFSLSMNIMIKNEEVNIGRQLITYAPIVREFIICDTGSTDKTKDFLNLVGITFYEKPFDNNFAEIRNDMIARSTQDYIMHVDADEMPEIHVNEKIVQMLNVCPDVALAHLETRHNDGRTQTIKQPRIFKRDPKFYYYGRVHETLDKSIEDAGFFTHQDLKLTILNPGFLTDTETIQHKLEFYGSLLEKELEDHPDNAKALFELALHYRNFGKMQEALELLLRSIALKPKFVRTRMEVITIYLNRALDIVLSCQGLPAEPEVRQALQQLHQMLMPWRFTPILPEKLGVEKENGKNIS